MLRKVAVAAASKPHVEIRQDGDQFYIKTSTTVRTTEINFKIGESFEEETVDGRKCRVGGEPRRVCACVCARACVTKLFSDGTDASAAGVPRQWRYCPPPSSQKRSLGVLGGRRSSCPSSDVFPRAG